MPSPLGLATYRWNNELKSIVILAAFPALLIGLVWLFFLIAGYSNASPQGVLHPHTALALGVQLPPGPASPFDLANEGAITYLPIALGVALTWLVIGTLFNNGLIRMATGAREVERKENPELYNLLENLCISRGITMPRLYIMETPMMNAFASGLFPSSYAITVTRGLLDKLDRDELEAVLAHELSHIMNKDVRLLIVTVLFTGMFSFFADMAWRSQRYRPTTGNRNGKGAGALLLLAAILLMVGYFVSILLRFALSRKREYLADAGAVDLTKSPDALIRALEKIAGHADMPHLPSGVQAMLIENPPSAFSLFATHPPIEARIAVLRRLGGLPEAGESIIPRAG